MLDVVRCKILIAGNCIFQRGVAGIVRDVAPSASIAAAFHFADARARLHREEFFTAIFDLDGDELTEPASFQTLRADCPRLILGVLSRTASPNASNVLSYLAAGVNGYILEKSGQSEVQRAVRQILSGAIYIPPNVAEPAAREPEPARPAWDRQRGDLTPRQDGVLALLLQGYSNKEIARQLKLSPHTVKIHVSALLRRFSVQKRSGLAAAAAARSERMSYRRADELHPIIGWWPSVTRLCPASAVQVHSSQDDSNHERPPVFLWP
jgi:DNA-binding NarL/FixJ family response regulator